MLLSKYAQSIIEENPLKKSSLPFPSSIWCDVATQLGKCSGPPVLRFCFISCSYWASSCPPWQLVSTLNCIARRNSLLLTKNYTKHNLVELMSLHWFSFIFLLSLLLFRFAPCGCDPFQGNQTVYNMTNACVDTLPYAAKTVIRYMTSAAFAVSLILMEM